MVVKLIFLQVKICSWFESRVILDGSQTYPRLCMRELKFESRVILDGSQTPAASFISPVRFESRVILDGSQTVGCL